MTALLGNCDVIMGNIWSVESLLGIPSGIESSQGKTDGALLSAAQESIKQLKKLYPAATTIAYTFRLDNRYWSVLNHHNQEYTSKQYPIDKVVDKVGTGDCFMAGIIFGLYNELEPTKMIEFSSAAAVGKHTEAGDHTSQSKNDVYSKILL